MFRRIACLAATGLVLSAACLGCNKDLSGLKLKDSAPKTVIPPHVAGTVAEYAALTGGMDMPVRGYCVVVGLGNNGSSEVPPTISKYLNQYLLKRKLSSPMSGTEELTPARFLQDKDTAVVQIDGVIPTGAPAGTVFDVVVGAMPQTQTRSLDGGILMPAELRMAIGGEELAGAGSKVFADAAGTIFVNPFVDPASPSGAAMLRIGRVIGGGKVTLDRSVRLVLRQSDYGRCRLLQRRINERFQARPPVATAKDASTIEITIPSERRKDYAELLRLILHLPLRSDQAGLETHSRQIAEAMSLPNANHEELSLVWEAMGRQVVPVVRPLYASPDAPAAFYAARAGARLGDSLAWDVLLRFAAGTSSRLQLPAVEELGRRREILRAVPVLRDLLDAENDLVRVAAYEALLNHGDRSMVNTTDIPGQFRLDVVTSRRSYIIYATRTREAKIVLFGKDMPVSRPVFFNAPDDLVTISAREADSQLLVFRKIPRTGNISDPFYVDAAVRPLVSTLGWQPVADEEGHIRGLGLTYGQVVSVLYRMCREGDIPAKFVLQQMPGARRMYEGVPAVGRPDTPED